MFYKQGQTTRFLVGLIIMIFIGGALVTIGYHIFSKNTDVRARVFFTDLLEYYEDCYEQEQTGCHCNVLDMGDFPEEHIIKVLNLEENRVGFQLIKRKRYTDDVVVMSAHAPSNGLCEYVYTLEQDVASFKIKPVDERLVYHYLLPVMLFKTGEDICFATGNVRRVQDAHPFCGLPEHRVYGADPLLDLPPPSEEKDKYAGSITR
jgi:hypothetical protein